MNYALHLLCSEILTINLPIEAAIKLIDLQSKVSLARQNPFETVKFLIIKLQQVDAFFVTQQDQISVGSRSKMW